MTLSRAAGALALAVVAPLHVHAQAFNWQTDPRIAATGVSHAVVQPNRAVLMLTLAGEGGSGADAVAQVVKLESVVREALQGLAVSVIPWGGSLGENQQIRRALPPDAVVTTSRDFLARYGVAVTLSDPGIVPTAIESLSRAGVKSIGSVLFLTRENDPAIEAALESATKVALQNAQRMAAAAGGELGPLMSLVNNPRHDMAMQQYFGYPEGLPPLQPSPIVLRIEVQGTWQFAGKK